MRVIYTSIIGHWTGFQRDFRFLKKIFSVKKFLKTRKLWKDRLKEKKNFFSILKILKFIKIYQKLKFKKIENWKKGISEFSEKFWKNSENFENREKQISDFSEISGKILKRWIWGKKFFFYFSQFFSGFSNFTEFLKFNNIYLKIWNFLRIEKWKKNGFQNFLKKNSGKNCWKINFENFWIWRKKCFPFFLIFLKSWIKII